MTALAGKIGSKIADKLAEKAFDELSMAITNERPVDFANEFKSIRDAIEASEQRVLTQITYLITLASYKDRVTEINGWCASLVEYSDNNAKGNTKNYKDLAKSLYDYRDHTNGLNQTLLGIHNRLVRPGDGVLATYINTLHEGLCGQDESKDMNTWYLKNIDDFLAGAFCVQMSGLALQIFMSSCSELTKEQRENDIESHKARIWSNFRAQRKAAYDAMHPVVQQLKTDYDTPVNEFRLWTIQALDGNRKLFRDGNGDPRIEPKEPSGDSIWRLLIGENRVWVQTASGHNLRIHPYNWASGVKRLYGHSVKVGTDHGFNSGIIFRDADCRYSEPYDLRTKIAPSKELTPSGQLIKAFRFVRPPDLGGQEKPHWLFDNDFQLTTAGVPGSFQPEGYQY